jgi:hypothetical protein
MRGGQRDGLEARHASLTTERGTELPMAAITYILLGGIVATFAISLLMILAYLVGASDRQKPSIATLPPPAGRTSL